MAVVGAVVVPVADAFPVKPVLLEGPAVGVLRRLEGSVALFVVPIKAAAVPVNLVDGFLA